jgi:iron(III) transport system ATP-binding protein
MLEVTNLVKTFDGEGKRVKKERGVAATGGTNVPGGTVYAVNNVTFTVEEGQLFTLLGPSGCGKTTTLRSIAGLEDPDGGSIRLGDRTLFSNDGRRSMSVPVNQRGLGMVFQSYAIWPHMSVFDNVAFPLQVTKRSERPSRAVIRQRVMKVLETMELDHLAKRQATKLSGGQQQRLALARAIVTEPSLLLLDEPLSNLDAKLRVSLRYELKRLQSELGITSIYVTHDQIEALALSSRIAVMRDGEIAQLGTPREIYERPSSQFVAEFIGTSNFLPGTVRGVEGDRVIIDSKVGQVTAITAEKVAVGSDVMLSARPETLLLGAKSAHPKGVGPVKARVLTRAYLGDAVDYVVEVDGVELQVRGNSGQRVPDGDEVYVSFDPERLTVLAFG